LAGPAGVVGTTGTVGVGGSPGDGITTAGVGVITVGAAGGGASGSPQATNGIATSINARQITPNIDILFFILFCSPYLNNSGLSQVSSSLS